MDTSCSVVVPVFNSESTLRELVGRLGVELPKLASRYEVILVNDCSRDRSWDVVCGLAKERPWVRGINLRRNFGQHNALLCGLRAARYAVTVTMDDDLQHPPEEIVKLLSKLDEGFDVVYGAPRKRPQSFWRSIVTRATKRTLAFVMGIPSVREIAAFRAFRTELRSAFETYQSPDVIIDVLLSWGTTRFGVTVVDEMPRQVGRSNYTLRKLVAITISVLANFSTAPLRFASLLGLLLTLFGVAVLAYVLIVYFAAGSVPGFPFLASIVTIFSGTQLFALGIFGEYLGRMFHRSMGRPTYVIRASVGSGSEPQP